MRAGAPLSAFTLLADGTAGRIGPRRPGARSGVPGEPSRVRHGGKPRECELPIRSRSRRAIRWARAAALMGGCGSVLTRSTFASSTRSDHSGVAVCGSPLPRRGPSAPPSQPLATGESVQDRLRGWNWPYRRTRQSGPAAVRRRAGGGRAGWLPGGGVHVVDSRTRDRAGRGRRAGGAGGRCRPEGIGGGYLAEKSRRGRGIAPPATPVRCGQLAAVRCWLTRCVVTRCYLTLTPAQADSTPLTSALPAL